MGIDGGEEFWLAVRGNLALLREAAPWWAVVAGEIEPAIEEPEFIAQAAGLLPPEPWTQDTWSAWTNAVKEATGRKGKPLFMPLRLALTGLDHGPELKALLRLIGRERAMHRLATPHA